MISIENVSRRGFLKGVVGAGAFVIGVRLMPMDLLASGDVGGLDASSSMGKAPLHPSVYVAIDTDGTAYIVAHRSEMGNGVRTALPRIVADELDADWARVKVVQATGDEKYGDQDTDGSHSVVTFFVPLREAGATARLMLVRAAAQQWNVPAEECLTELHTVVHKKSGKKVGYGELVAAATKQDVPKKEELKLKPRSEWRYIGKDASGYDLKDLCTGKGIYGQHGEVAGQQRDAGGQGHKRDGDDSDLQAAGKYAGAGRRGGVGRQHMGGDAGAKEVEGGMGRERAQSF